MTEQEVNKLLYEKMCAEHEAYKEYLRTCTPDLIMAHSARYVQHEQVLRCFAERDLPKKQAEILLKCKCPISKLLGRLGFLIEMKPDEVYAAAEKTAQYLLKYPGTIHDRG